MNLDKQELADLVKTKVLPIVSILAVVIIFFVMISDANKPETPATPTPAQSAAADPQQDRGKQMAQMQEIIKKSDGNWDHLSSDDQGVMNGVTGGHGKDALRMMSKQAKNKSKQPSASPKPHS